jgi:DNA-binding IclR family transcriptional regulator
MFRWLAGSKPLASPIPGGVQKRLCESAAGWLLLSTLSPERREGVIRRLRAEAPAEERAGYSALSERVQECGRQGYVVGPAGFNPTADICAILLPSEPGERPMVLGFVYEPCEEINPEALLALLRRSVQSCVGQPGNAVAWLNTDATKMLSASAA